MAEGLPNVLPLYDPPRKMSYRAAVARIVREVKARYHLSNVMLADKLDCSDETISNAENENTDLNAVTLLRIAYVFGEEAIDPVRELYLCRHAAPKSVPERIADLKRELDMIGREVAA